VLSARTGTLAHISLTRDARKKTRDLILNPSGIGDEFAGLLALAYLRATSHLTGNTPLLDATRAAWAELLKNRTSLESDNSWFNVTVLGHASSAHHQHWLAQQGIVPNISW